MVVSALRGPLWGFRYFLYQPGLSKALGWDIITYCLVALLGDFVRIRACNDSEALYGDPVAL